MRKTGKTVFTKEETKKYVGELQKSVGNRERIFDLLDNQDLFLEYLRTIGVNPDWFQRAAIVEIAREEIRKILMDKTAKVTSEGIFYGGNKSLCVRDGSFFICYTGSDNEFKRFMPVDIVEDVELEGEKRFVKDKELVEDTSQTTDFVEYTEHKVNEYAIGKVIDRNGVVQLEKVYKPYQFIGIPMGLDESASYLRCLNGKQTSYRETVYAGTFPHITNGKRENYANPVTANGIADPRILDYLERYPRYKSWFESKNFNLEHIISVIEDEHKKTFDRIQAYTGSRYDAQVSKTETFFKREKKLVEYYKFLGTISAKAKKAFERAVEKEIAEENYIGIDKKYFAKRIKAANEGKISMEKQNVEIKRYQSLNEVTKDAKIRLEERYKRAGINPSSLSNEERKCNLLIAREEILNEIIKKQERLKQYDRDCDFQSMELDVLKSALRRIPFVGIRATIALKTQEFIRERERRRQVKERDAR